MDRPCLKTAHYNIGTSMSYSVAALARSCGGNCDSINLLGHNSALARSGRHIS
jgi:hypothetical protein